MFFAASCALIGRRHQGRRVIEAPVLLDAVALESRVLMSATPMPSHGADGGLNIDLQLAESPFEHLTPSNADMGLAPPAAGDNLPPNLDSRLELVFIDAHVNDYHLMLDHLSPEHARGDFEIILLDETQDGVRQITEELTRHSEVDAVHILSHGANGRIQLGNSWLQLDNLEGYASDLTHWGDSLALDADLLIYGCELANDDAGQALVDAIHSLTGADVAASTDNTGHRDYGGDWQLEYAQGLIQTDVVISDEAQDGWDRLLAVVAVTTTDDVVNGDISSVAALIADPGNDGISLREAILATNADIGADTIVLADGTYTLSITGAMEDGALSGDLDISDSLTISGSSATKVAIDGNGIDRVFHVINGSVTFADITIKNGVDATEGTGGGVLNEAAATFVNVVVRDNVALNGNGEGGGLYNADVATVLNSTFHDNHAVYGGGIFNRLVSNALDISVSTFSGNTATDTGGALYDDNGANLVSVTLGFNSANVGGGLHSTGNTSILNSIVASNSASTAIDVSGPLLSGGNNLFGDSGGASGFVISDLLDLDARLIPLLAGHLGSTPTHQLYADSPAIDAGQSVGTPAMDQTRTARDIDGDGLNGAEHDIGAFEYRPVESNAPPQALSITNTVIAHGTDTTGGYQVGTLTTTDPDAGETFLYEIVGGLDSASFTIGGAGADELIVDDGLLDSNLQSQYEVIVKVTDSGGNYADLTFTISVNAPPTIVLANTLPNLPENTDTSSPVKVADIIVSDDGFGTNLLSISGADWTQFEIVGTELYLRVGTALNFEQQSSLDVTIEVDDVSLGSTPDATVDYGLLIDDVNEAPTGVSLIGSVTSLAEGTDTTNRVKIADIVVSDDLLGTNSLSLSGSDWTLFEIVGGTELYLRAGTVLDFEQQPSLDVVVEVNDATVGATPDATVSHTLSVTNVNEVPSVSLVNLVSLAEDLDTSNPVLIADIDVDDDILGTNTLTLLGPDEALFEIVGTELYLRAGTPLNFESKSSFDLTITVDDPTIGATPDDSEAVTVFVTDVNEAPLIAPAGVAHVLENNLSVTVVNAIDPDGDSLRYGITGGLDEALFDVNVNTGLVTFLAAPDYEQPLDSDRDNVYQVRVTAVDPFGSTASQMLSVVVDPINDMHPVFVSKATASVMAGTQDVMSVLAIDGDLPSSQVTYRIAGGDDAKFFDLDGDTGELQFVFVPSANFPKDMDGNNVYELVVQADDSQGRKTHQLIRVQVTPDKPPVATNDFHTVGNDGELIVGPNTGVLSNDFDPEGGSLQVVLLRGPANGTIIFNDDGSFRYKPLISFVGDDKFVYAIKDEQGNVSMATVTVEVTASSSPTQNDDAGGSTNSTPSSTPANDPAANPLPDLGLLSDNDLSSNRRIDRVIRGVSIDTNETIALTEQVPLIQVAGSSSSIDAAAKSVDLVSISSFESVFDVRDLSEITTYNFVTGAADYPDRQDEFNSTMAPRGVLMNVVAGSAGLFGTAWAWYLIWLVRSGSIVSTLMTQLPAWTIVDPLPVLNYVGKDSGCDDDEQLEMLVTNSGPQEE